MNPIGAAFDQRRRRRNTIDAVVDEYVRWREACLAVRGAYDSWAIARPSERRLAHAAYVGALDREEEAAANYERRIEDAVAR
jgi:hypothetical protein